MVKEKNISPEEEKFRSTFTAKYDVTKDKGPLRCTACWANITSFIVSGKSCHLHAFLKVLVCKRCQQFYGNGEFSVDEDGDEKYCRWCGQGGSLLYCDKCNSGFCKSCVQRNFSRDFYEKLKRKSKWDCFMCVPKPLYEARAKAWAAQKHYLSLSNKDKCKDKTTAQETPNLKDKKSKQKKSTDLISKEKEMFKMAKKWLAESMDNSIDLANEILTRSNKIKVKRIGEASVTGYEDVANLESNVQRYFDSLIKNIEELKKGLTSEMNLWKASYDRDFDRASSTANEGAALQEEEEKEEESDDEINAAVERTMPEDESSDEMIEKRINGREKKKRKQRDESDEGARSEDNDSSDCGEAECDKEEGEDDEEEEKVGDSKNKKKIDEERLSIASSSADERALSDDNNKEKPKSKKAKNAEKKKDSNDSDSDLDASVNRELEKCAEKLLESSSSDDLLEVESDTGKVDCSQEEKKLSKKGEKSKKDIKEKKSNDAKCKEEEEEDDKTKETKEMARLTNLKGLEKTKKVISCDSDSDSAEIAKPKLKTAKPVVKKESEVGSEKSKEPSSSSDADDDDDDVDDLMDFKIHNFKRNEDDCQQRILQYFFESSENSGSNDEEEEEEEEEETEEEEEENKKEKKTMIKMENVKKSDDDNSDDSATEFRVNKRLWRRDKLLTGKLTDTDTSEDEKRQAKWKKRQNKSASDESSDDEVLGKKKKKERPNKIVLSDSDIVEISESDSSSSVEIVPKGKKRKHSSDNSDSSEDVKKKKKKKRKRIVNGGSSSESDDDEEKGDDDELNDSNTSPGKGRRNIKKIMKDRDVAEATRSAAKDEEERRQRILERQKLYNAVYEAVEENATKKVDKLVLDFDVETKKPIIEVDKGLVAKMKPHQAKGVKFMWDACYESVERIKTSKGCGCILAHCMGLGKTFQVISLVHTLLSYKKLTKVRRVLIVCPFSTVLNWYQEFEKWLKDVEENDDLNVNHIANEKVNYRRSYRLKDWYEEGGVMIMGYDMYRNLTNEKSKTFKSKIKESFQTTLVKPGPDLVVCDEGHLLKNEATALSKAMTKIQTLRRIVLTGTPLQNNLVEYHCMVSFIKPNLLGTKKEFTNRFVNPINNGQFADSTERDFRIMKRRAHVLHKMLDGLVQRRDYNVLTPYLPPKQEYVLSIRLTDLQVQLYREFLKEKGTITKGIKVTLLADFQQLSRVWTHPLTLKRHFEKQLKKAENDGSSDSAGSLKNFVVDGSSDAETSSSSETEGSGSAKENAATAKRLTRANKKDDEELDVMEDDPEEMATVTKSAWWGSIVEPEHFNDIGVSSKLIILFEFLKHCDEIGDKVLVFSQSLYSLDLIEHFLNEIDEATQKGNTDDPFLKGHTGSWSRGIDYFRLDGSTKGENRSAWIKSFNRESNTRARLFLISTKAGGLGINLTAANRVVIFDASWNPSHDIQSIFRIYRFGQRKPCYIYRFIAQGTMEEKVYERQISKLSLSQRVVDEQQVNRYFSQHDLQELYNFKPANQEDAPIPIVPKDRIMAEILQKHKEWIFKIFEHDSLLDHVEEEELDEEERKAAWEEFENEKKRAFVPPPASYLPPAGAMDFNVIKNSLPPETYDKMLQMVAQKYPNKSAQEVHSIAVKTMTQVYIKYQNDMLIRQQQNQQKQQQQHIQQNYQQYLQTFNTGQGTQFAHQQRVPIPNIRGTQPHYPPLPLAHSTPVPSPSSSTTLSTNNVNR